MIVQRTSMLSGMIAEMDLPITEEQINYWLENNLLIQDVFPHLTAEQREFLISGIAPQEWDALLEPTCQEKILVGPDEDYPETWDDDDDPTESLQSAVSYNI